MNEAGPHGHGIYSIASCFCSIGHLTGAIKWDSWFYTLELVIFYGVYGLG